MICNEAIIDFGTQIPLHKKDRTINANTENWRGNYWRHQPAEKQNVLYLAIKGRPLMILGGVEEKIEN